MNLAKLMTIGAIVFVAIAAAYFRPAITGFVSGEPAQASMKFIGNQFTEGKASNFAVQVRNIRTTDITNAQVIIDIYSMVGTKLDTVYSDRFNVKSEQDNIVRVDWTPSIGTGSFKAKATLIYEAKSLESEMDFTIGAINLEIVDVDASDFSLGGIAGFKIYLQNQWNEPLSDVYADVNVKDDNGNTVGMFQTSKTKIPQFESQEISGYWETEGLLPGKYTFDMTLHYDDNEAEHSVDINVEYDEITPTGKAIRKTDPVAASIEWLTRTAYVLVFLVFGLIGFNIYIHRRSNQ